MVFRSLFNKFKPEIAPEEEYIELDFEGEEKPEGKVLIQVDKIEDYADSDRVQRKVRNGNIVLVRIKELKEKNIGELKRAISRIRKTCMAINGDIAGVADDWIVVTPSFAKIHRGEEAPPPVISTPAQSSTEE